VNNVRIITIIQTTQQTKLRVEPVKLDVSSVSSHAVWQARHSRNAWARHVERVESCRVEMRRAKWNLSYVLGLHVHQRGVSLSPTKSPSFYILNNSVKTESIKVIFVVQCQEEISHKKSIDSPTSRE